MLEEITSQLLEAKEKRNHGTSLRRQLPQMRDELASKVYQLQTLEAGIDGCQVHIDKLQSLSLSAIMASLTGRKESQLTACLEEIERYQQEFDSCSAVVTTLETQLLQAETELANMGQLDKNYEQLLDKKKTLICQSNSEQANELENLAHQITEMKDDRQVFDEAVKSGEQAIEKLFSMIRTKGRSRKKGINSHAGGVLMATAVNHVLQGNPAKPAIRRAVESLEKFHQSILQLGYNSDHPRDAHIKELIGIVAIFSADMSSGGVSRIVWDASQEGPILDAVQEMVGLLQEDRGEIAKRIETLNDKNQTLIENA